MRLLHHQMLKLVLHQHNHHHQQLNSMYQLNIYKSQNNHTNKNRWSVMKSATMTKSELLSFIDGADKDKPN